MSWKTVTSAAMSSEPGRSFASRSRRPLRVATVGGVVLVLLASLGCGLKGDPLPPIRPPEPEAEADSAAAEPEGAERAEDAGEEPEADDGDGEDDEDSEEEGEGAQRPA